MPLSRYSKSPHHANFHWQFLLENFMEGTSFGYKRVWRGISEHISGN